MKRIQKIAWQARYWASLWWWWSVGWRWYYGSRSVRRWLVGRARDEVRVWCAMGCPAEWRPVRAFRWLAAVRVVRVGLVVVALLLGPWLVALLLRWLF